MPSISREIQDWFGECNSRFIALMREVGLRGGESVNVLVTADVLLPDLEPARAILVARGLETIHERTRGFFRKRYILESRTGDFPFDENVLAEWNLWAMNTFAETELLIYIGVCRAKVP